jgi:hypothetical protein
VLRGDAKPQQVREGLPNRGAEQAGSAVWRRHRTAAVRGRNLRGAEPARGGCGGPEEVRELPEPGCPVNGRAEKPRILTESAKGGMHRGLVRMTPAPRRRRTNAAEGAHQVRGEVGVHDLADDVRDDQKDAEQQATGKDNDGDH